MGGTVKDYITDNFPKTIRCNKKDSGTLIGLPHRYTVPCTSDMFEELYYWDIYFINAGLLAEGNTELAKDNIDNMLYMVDKFGFMPNGNRTYYLDRSQPPFLSQMIRELYEVSRDKEWLAKAYKTLKTEYSFWQGKRVLRGGLNGYTGYEIDKTAIDGKVSYGLSRMGYKPDVITDEVKKEIYLAINSFCESGWDCNSRYLEKPHEFYSVELNALLYGMEENMRYFSDILQNGETQAWQEWQTKRKDGMRILWKEDEGVFKDFSPYTNRFAGYASAATFYPLFTGLATKEQAEKIVAALPRFELEYGISAGEQDPPWCCQWDYPNIWAPIQFIVYQGLMNYGYLKDAQRIARKYVGLVEKNFEETGHLWEKYNGLTGKTANDEYGAPKMLGWTAGVYISFVMKNEKDSKSYYTNKVVL